MGDRQVILCAGVGDLGKYTCEELLASPQFDVAVLSRRKEHLWCKQRLIPVHFTDYTQPSLKSICNATQATTVISFINLVGEDYINTHANLLAACLESDTCKRLIPSEWIGDSEKFPDLPQYYATSRGPIRQMLAAQTEVEWTLFNVGLFADYLLPEEKTYMKPIPGKFPIDRGLRSALIRGTGDEPQSWISAREVGKAVMELCKASSWDTHTFVAGDWKTFNEVIRVVERFTGQPVVCTHKSSADIKANLAAYANESELSDAGESVQFENMVIEGCLSCPQKKTLRQRKNYFSGMRFSTMDEILRHAESVDFV